MESVCDKVVLITGASSGIGASTAVLFAKYGSKLALTARNTANLEKTAEQCAQWGLSKDKILLITADVTKDEDLQRIIMETENYFHKLDVLVNNAGIAIGKSMETITMTEVDHQLNVNLRAVIALTKLAIPLLKATKGVIVNVSSVNSVCTDATSPIYSVTKAALDMFNSSLAVDLGKYGIRVNTVNPGDIKTPIHVKMGYDADRIEEIYQEMGETQYPLGRVGEPHEVAYPIVFLASDAASFISGSNLFIDGAAHKTSSWYSAQTQAVEQEQQQAADTQK